MSNPSVPPTAPEPQGGRPAPDWTPAPLGSGDDASYANRGPQAVPPPTGPHAAGLPKVQVEQFAPTRSPWPILAGVAIVLVAALIIYTTIWRPSTPPSASGSPSPSAGQSSEPGRSATPEPGQPFIAPGGDPAGSWEVVEHHWDASGLEVLVRIKVTTGTLDYSLNVIDTTGRIRTPAQVSAQTPALTFEPILAGQEVRGWVRFAADRGDTTLAMLTGIRDQLSALPISG